MSVLFNFFYGREAVGLAFEVRIETMNEIFNTFDLTMEKGRGEWRTFNAVAHDKTSLINASALARVIKPRVPTAIRFGASRLFILKRA